MQPIPVAALLKAWVCRLSLVRIVGSNPGPGGGGGRWVYLVHGVCCHVEVCDYSSREVWCIWV